MADWEVVQDKKWTVQEKGYDLALQAIAKAKEALAESKHETARKLLEVANLAATVDKVQTPSLHVDHMPTVKVDKK